MERRPTMGGNLIVITLSIRMFEVQKTGMVSLRVGMLVSKTGHLGQCIDVGKVLSVGPTAKFPPLVPPLQPLRTFITLSMIAFGDLIQAESDRPAESQDGSELYHLM